MKKEYMKPDMKVFELKAKQQLLAGSGDVQSLQFKRNGSDEIDSYDGEFN